MAKKLSFSMWSNTSFFQTVDVCSKPLTPAMSLTVNWWHVEVRELRKLRKETAMFNTSVAVLGFSYIKLVHLLVHSVPQNL